MLGDALAQQPVVDPLELVRALLSEAGAGGRRVDPVGHDDGDEVGVGHRPGSAVCQANCSGRNSETSVMTSAGSPARRAASTIASALGAS